MIDYRDNFDYQLERIAMQSCAEMVRMQRNSTRLIGRERRIAHWLAAFIEHRDNARRIRRTGRIAPF